MSHIYTIIRKQCKDTLKNNTVLIQFLMFPLLSIVMSNAVRLPDMPANFFVNLFSTMYIGMAPLTSVSAIISEEKEKQTLRVLLFSGVRPLQYLLGIGSYIFLACMLGSTVFCCLLKDADALWHILFLLIMAAGILASMTLGAVIGIYSSNQMSATSVTVPVMMVFSFLPMLSMFNEKIARIAKFTYSGQIRLLLEQAHSGELLQPLVVIAANSLVFVLLFCFCYKKKGLE